MLEDDWLPSLNTDAGGVLSKGRLPGFGAVHAIHLSVDSLLLIRHVSQVQDPTGGLNLSIKESVEIDEFEVGFRTPQPLHFKTSALFFSGQDAQRQLPPFEFVSVVFPGVVGLLEPATPGLAVVQATHLFASALFSTRHVSHSQLPMGGLNASNRELVVTRDAFVDESGFGVVHATHLLTSCSF